MAEWVKACGYRKFIPMLASPTNPFHALKCGYVVPVHKGSVQLVGFSTLIHLLRSPHHNEWLFFYLWITQVQTQTLVWLVMWIISCVTWVIVLHPYILVRVFFCLHTCLMCCRVCMCGREYFFFCPRVTGVGISFYPLQIIVAGLEFGSWVWVYVPSTHE